MTTNQKLAKIFQEMASALELLGANPFRSVSNARIARQLADMGESVDSLVAEAGEEALSRLVDLPGIGKGSAEKILEYLETGEVEEHQELLAQVPIGLFAVLDVPGIGPKAARAMWQKLGITSIDDLRDKLDSPDLAALPRMGKKSIDNLRQALAFSAESQDRIPLGQARPIALALLETLRQAPGLRKIDYAGSLRRGRETIGDLDFLIASDDPEAIRELFTSLQAVTQVLARGETKCSVRLKVDAVAVQADLRLVPEGAYGAALLYFTGSKEHNVRLREIAIKKGWRLNEYGLFEGTEERPQDRGQEPLAARTEEEIYAALELPFIAPERREDQGELSGQTPRLIELSDIGAELHAHTVASDGKLTIEELAACARQRGLHTLAITDHSQSAVLAGGLTPEQLKKHMASVRAADRRIADIKLLAGAEVDILVDGSLDYDDELLAELDVVVASPHASLRQDSETATRRLLRAIEHPLVHILGHPTGRILNQRQGLEPEMARLFAAAAENDVALELNSSWRRLDLRDTHVRGALDHGCLVAIDTDAHREAHLDFLIYGILTARRAGLEPRSCINAWPAEQLHQWLRSKR